MRSLQCLVPCMRSLQCLALALAACSGTSDRASSPAPANATPTKPIVAPALDKAALIVRGRATTTPAGAPTASIQVERILKGASGPAVVVSAQPAPLADIPKLYVLAAEGDHFRVDDVLPVDQETAVIAALADTVASVPTRFASELATFRAGAGKPWSPANGPAMDAADIVFSQISWIGVTAQDVEAALGKPDSVTANAWHYMRHDGESGVSRVLHFHADRVSAVEIQMTQ